MRKFAKSAILVRKAVFSVGAIVPYWTGLGHFMLELTAQRLRTKRTELLNAVEGCQPTPARASHTGRGPGDSLYCCASDAACRFSRACDCASIPLVSSLHLDHDRLARCHSGSAPSASRAWLACESLCADVAVASVAHWLASPTARSECDWYTARRWSPAETRAMTHHAGTGLDCSTAVGGARRATRPPPIDCAPRPRPSDATWPAEGQRQGRKRAESPARHMATQRADDALAALPARL